MTIAERGDIGAVIVELFITAQRGVLGKIASPCGQAAAVLDDVTVAN